MKNILFLITLFFIGSSITAQDPLNGQTQTQIFQKKVREIKGPSKNLKSRLISADEKMTHVRMSLPALKLVSEKTPKGEFQRIIAPKGDRSFLINGEEYISYPEIPVHSFLVALPIGTKPNDIRVKPSGGKTIKNVILYPVQTPYFATIEKATNTEFVFDEKRYANSIFGDNNNFIAEQISSEPVNIWRITVPAADYRSKERRLTVFDHVDIRISYFSENPCFSYERESNRFKLDDLDRYRSRQDDYYSHLVVNPDLIESIRCPYPGITHHYGAEFLIVTDPAFLTAAQDLRAHKESLGIRTRVVTTSTILSDEGATDLTDEVIRDWINNYRVTSVVQTKWLLLIGDSEFIPTHYISIEANRTRCSGDQYYGQLNADSLAIPSMGIGRFPIDSLVTAQRIVDRVINYELNPPSSWSYYRDMAFAAEFQDNEPDGIANRWFAETSENIRDHLLPKFYNVERIYKTRDTVVPKLYYDGTPIPTELERPGFAWDGSANDVINAVNDGSIIVYHRDHGSKNGWGKPRLRISDLANISISNNEHPLVFSINCASGVFDNETANLPENLGSGAGMNVSVNAVYWAEQFFNQEHGAIGIVGDTRNSSTTMNNLMAKGLFDAMFPTYETFGGTNSINRIGDVLNHAKGYVANSSSSINGVYKENTIYNLFGDPSLEVNPQSFYVVLPGKWKFIERFWTLDYKINPIECDKCPRQNEYKPEFIVGTLIHPKTDKVMARTVVKSGQPLQFQNVKYKGPATVVVSAKNMQTNSYKVKL